MANKKRQKREFSKVIFVIIFVFVLTVNSFACVMAWVTKDNSLFAWLVPSSWVELGVGTAFYYDKARRENEIKLQKQMEKERAHDRPDTRI